MTNEEIRCNIKALCGQAQSIRAGDPNQYANRHLHAAYAEKLDKIWEQADCLCPAHDCWNVPKD